MRALRDAAQGPSERNQKLVAYAMANPCVSLQTIGDHYGISRERVRKIIERAGEHKSHARRLPIFLCALCEKPTESKGGICIRCRWVELPCVNCGEMVRRRTASLTYPSRQQRYKGRVFCDRHCFYSWSGRTHGAPTLRAYQRARLLKSVCKRGHLVAGDNAHIDLKGRRHCRACWRARRAEKKLIPA